MVANDLLQLMLHLAKLVEVLADANQLADPPDIRREVIDNPLVELHGHALMVDVDAGGIADEPFVLGEQPGVDAVPSVEVQRLLHQFGRCRVPLDDAPVGSDKHASVEAGIRRFELQRLRDVRHPARRAGADHRELDACRL